MLSTFITAPRTARLLAIVLALAISQAARAAEPLSRASNSRAAREDAAASIPFDRLPRETRGKVASVVNNPSIFRRMPIEMVESDPDLYLFLIRNPEVVVNIWQVMGITNMTLDRIGPDKFRASDGQGTTGIAEYVYRSADTHVIYSDGAYDGSLSPARLRGQCVLVLKTGYIRQPSGRTFVTTRLDAFLHLDNIGAEWVARTLQPLVGRTADHNFDEAATFLATLSHTAETNPQGIARLSRKLTRVDPAMRGRFADLSAQAAQRAETADNSLAQAPATQASAVMPASQPRGYAPQR